MALNRVFAIASNGFLVVESGKSELVINGLVLLLAKTKHLKVNFEGVWRVKFKLLVNLMGRENEVEVVVAVVVVEKTRGGET